MFEQSLIKLSDLFAAFLFSLNFKFNVDYFVVFFDFTEANMLVVSLFQLTLLKSYSFSFKGILLLFVKLVFHNCLHFSH